MKKICCLLLLVMLCMSTTYAARGKECIKYLCGEWAVPNTDTIYYFDDKGEIIQPEMGKFGIDPNEPAIRHKYKNIDESSYIDDNTGKGTLIITYERSPIEYEFINFKQMRFRYYQYPEWSSVYTKFSDTANLHGSKIIDYDTIAEPPLNTYNEGAYFYTPDKGEEQLKLVISKDKEHRKVITFYNKEGKSVYNYTFARDAGVLIRKIYLRSGKADLLCYSLVGTGQYIQEFFILGKTNNGIGKLYDIGKNGYNIGSMVKVWVEYDSIHISGVNGYNGADSRGLKRNPTMVVMPTMQSGKGYTYKMLSLEDFYKYKAAKSKSSKPVL